MNRPGASTEALVENLSERGLVVLERIVPSDCLEELRPVCSRVVGRSPRSRMRVPLELLGRSPFRGGLVTAFPLVWQILKQALGSDPRSTEYWIRACRPGGTQQAVHRDRRNPLARESLPPTAFSVDIALSDVTEQNGATEIWPGSHRIFDRDQASLRATPRRAAELSSVRLVMPAASVAVRDLRLWHRAMPNRTLAERLILSVTVDAHAA